MNFLTAFFIASAPSLTLKPTCCSCISAMMWSACWSTAADSISFRGVSQSAIGLNFVFFVPSGLSISLISGTMLVVSQLCLPSPSSTSEPNSRMSSILQERIAEVSGGNFSFSTYRVPHHVVISSLARTLHLESGFIFQAIFLHFSLSSFILANSSSGKSSLGSFAWIIFVVSSPGDACVLLNMICFAALKHPLFALNIALFTLLV